MPDEQVIIDSVAKTLPELDTPRLRAAIANVMLERAQWLKQVGLSFNGARDMYEVLGYNRSITVDEYRGRYARGGIAKRLIEARPSATWNGGFDVVEDKDPEKVTPFEQAWRSLDKRLNITNIFLRADILTGLSTYAVILIGARGDLSTPLGRTRTGDPKGILYLTPFLGGGEHRNSRTSTITTMGADCTIEELEDDPSSARFGLPRSYKLRRLDISNPNLQKPVHHSRILHLAEGVLDNEVYGQPVLENVWNLLDDLDKVTGGGAEAFWLRANRGLQLDVAKDMQLSDTEKAALQSQADEYAMQMRRMLRTRGVTVHDLGSEVANFQESADAILTQIAGSKGIPKRILTGSEMGQLASGQDRENWRDQTAARQRSHAIPVFVRPFIDRMIEHGYLPEPKEYDVIFPPMETQTAQEKAEGAAKWASVNQSAGRPVFTADEIRDYWFGFAPITDDQLNKELDTKKKVTEALTPPELNPETGERVDPNPAAGPRPIDNERGAKEDLDLDARAAELLDLELASILHDAQAAGNQALVDRILGVHTFSSTQIDLPANLARTLLAYAATIPDDELAKDGREHHPHVTVKYGLHTLNADDVRAVVAGFGPVTLTLDSLDIFSADEHDVLIARVTSDDLHDLNAAVASLPHTDTHAEYVPHATIAYLKKGYASKYLDQNPVTGQSYTADTIRFIARDGAESVIGLTELSRAAGGPGSGNFGHAGRPGKVGGSASHFLSDADDAVEDLIAGRPTTVTRADVREVIERSARENNPNLVNLAIEGTRVFHGGLNTPRDKMPQIPSHLNREFFTWLKDEHGVTIRKQLVRPLSLTPSQGEISGTNVAGKLKQLDAGQRKATPIMVSGDRYVLDGHHRWGAYAVFEADHPEGGVKIPVYRMSASHTRALSLMHQFTEIKGIKGKSIRDLGGPGSGHHGHAGRPGKIGGSAPTFSGIDVAPIERSPEGGWLISTRQPTSKRIFEKAEQRLVTNLDLVLQDNDAVIRAAEIFSESGLLTEAEMKMPPEQQVRAAVASMKANLRLLYNDVDPDIADRAGNWYFGAHRMAGDLAAEHGMERHQVAGVIATLSPQMDWFQNVSLAERVITITKKFDKDNPEFTQDMFDKFAGKWSAATEQKGRRAKPKEFSGTDAEWTMHQKTLSAERDSQMSAIRDNVGKRWKELPPTSQAFMLRTWDEQNNSRDFYITNPEGDKLGFQTTGTGANRKIGWGTTATIEDAMSITRDGSMENINMRVGGAPKVRSFYNNIADPWDDKSVTIDTHAIAAAYLRPFSGASKEVVYGMGGGKGNLPTNNVTGLKGTNPIIAQAYFDLAGELGILPDRLQSVTWEAARGLFRPEQKRSTQGAKLAQETQNLWSAYSSGKITREVLYDRLKDAAGGIEAPAWAGSPVSEQGRMVGRSISSGRTVVSARRRHNGADSGRSAGPDARSDDRRLREGVSGVEARELGGPGSGNFGHAGRPGKVGGSAPSPISQPSSAYPIAFDNAMDTQQRFKVGNRYTPERQALHEAIVAKHLEGTTPVEHPVATFLGGGMASGKSTILEQEKIGGENTVQIDADKIREDLPEYRETKMSDPMAATFVHEEASDITKLLMRRAADTKRNMLIDGGGDSSVEKLAQKANALRSAGHEVHGTYVSLPTDIAMQNMLRRAAITNRYVPETVLRTMHRQVSRVFPAAVQAGVFDTVQLFDTELFENGRAQPRLVMRGRKTGEIEVVNTELWQKFLAKGNE